MNASDIIAQIPMGLLAVIGIIALLMLICKWMIFEKAGQPGWAAIIPIYNYYIMTKVINKPGYWTVLMILPYVNIVFLIWSVNLLSKKFGKDIGYTLGLLFLAPIFYPMLAFGSAQYQVEKNESNDLLDN